MLDWLPSIPYPAPKPASYGYWAPITSTLTWCEENYYATSYCAEIVNTLTNLIFVALAFKGMRNCWKNGHDRIFFITFLGYLLVGSGSFAFHASLKYPMQLVDELSMIYTTCLATFASFEHKRPMAIKIFLGAAISALAAFITVYYHVSQNPAFHQNAYAILTAVVLIRSMYIMESNMRPHFRQRHKLHQANQKPSDRTESEKAEERRQDARDREILRHMWTMVALGLTAFLGAFAIWNLDNMYCSTLRRWRRSIGLPWAILLEGHGWWHIGTGLGAYFYIVWGIWLRHCLNGRQDEYEVIWPSVLTSIPEIVRRRAAPTGSSKKLR